MQCICTAGVPICHAYLELSMERHSHRLADGSENLKFSGYHCLSPTRKHNSENNVKSNW